MFYHEVLLAKLENYVVRGIFLKWFGSFLKERCQYVQVNDALSDFLLLLVGAP